MTDTSLKIKIKIELRITYDSEVSKRIKVYKVILQTGII